jgi:hypothetical protein
MGLGKTPCPCNQDHEGGQGFHNRMYDDTRSKTKHMEGELVRMTQLKGIDAPETRSITADLKNQRGWITHHARYADPDHVQKHLLPAITEH